ncbi:MAG: hypothetical protein Q7T23_17180 [Phenylobacterium sp.]|nr:hypothetical protein [Phenylobacterium sp.]
MSIRDLLAATALSLGLVLTLTAPAAAQPHGKGGNYSLAPAPRPAPDRVAKPNQGEAHCVCPMMKDAGALHRRPMTPGADPQAQPATPGLPG